MASYHKIMSAAGELGMPLYPAHGVKLIRSPEKLMHAKGAKPVPFVTPPKGAVTMTGWPGSTPRTERLHVWTTKQGVMFATPHNQKAGLIVKDGFAFIPSEKRVALGIETAKPKGKGKAKGKAKGKSKSNATKGGKSPGKRVVKARKAKKS